MFHLAPLGKMHRISYIIPQMIADDPKGRPYVLIYNV